MDFFHGIGSTVKPCYSLRGILECMKRVMDIGDPLPRLIAAYIHHLRVIERRLPFLQRVVSEAKLMAGEAPPARNDIVTRMFLDSCDMLVIDLCSLRERVATKGLFTHLHRYTSTLRRFKPGDFDVEWMRIDEWSAESQEHQLAEERQRLADTSNAHFDFLFPGVTVVSHAEVGALIDRFLVATRPTQLDRNKARAHRYEERPENAARHAQTLDQIDEQLRVFERYFHSLFWVATACDYPMDYPAFFADEAETARDIADLVVLGSIGEAVMRYGVMAKGDEDSFYWKKRADFFAAGGKVTD